ncbi:MAG: glycosyltransferase family 39 protein [Bacteroidetes bacterium]|nr:glycosyltransferase family 39 protein [Bacteroidota bacterium]
MMRQLKTLWEEKPLTLILFTAIFFRLLSVIFSKGYGMHDDHFLVIESAQSWVDNFDYNGWLPSSSSQPSGHSWFYCGIHYCLFWLMKAIGISDPQGKMYIIRFLHAALALVTVVLGYKIAELVSNKSTARMVGILLATYWFMPFLSVRNLIEVVCVPFLIIPTWMLLKKSPPALKGADKSSPFLPSGAGYFFLAGIIAGIAFSIRFQSILFIGGLGLALLLQKKWKEGILYGIGAVLCMALMQGIIDLLIWGKPFMEVHEYVRYNIEFAQKYIVQQWYMYFALLFGILLPPISFFLLFGFFRRWKKHLLLFLPSFIFLAFHCYFPSKQERFIFPIIPFIIILGIIGWNDFVNTSSFWNNRKKLLRACWIFFWSLNLIPLLVVSVAYSKRSRVEAMVYLSTKKDSDKIVVEESFRDDYTMPPFFYLGKWYRSGYIHGITSEYTVDAFCKDIEQSRAAKPNYVIFFDEENLDNRIKNFKTCFPNITYETTIEPGFIDKFIYWLNPINRNYTAYIYKIEK